MLTLSRSLGALSNAELRRKSTKVHWLAHVAHEGMAGHLVPKLLPEASATLSARELEILRWTSDGKTSHEVAEILNLSKRTIDFHINNAVLKLNATNKTAAAIKAAKLGLL